ncbi:MAG: SDR family NAD(P)-dependent oxidoreductase [Cyclobacteriaceae bacterium]
MSKTYLITGAVGNLGKSVTSKLTSEGHQVIGTVRSIKSNEESSVDYRACDLTDEIATKDLFDSLKASYEHIDGVVMLVGGFGMSNLLTSTSNDLNKMLNLNLMTAYHTAKYAAEWMHNNGGTKLIFVGAKPAIAGGSEVLPYAISKNAVMHLAQIINEDPNLKNIQASVIIPSIIDTPVNREFMPDANFKDWVSPEEIAENISYLLSEQANPLRDTVLKLYNNT